jgi:MFS family permease
MRRNLFVLALCQGLFLTNNVAFIAINGLVGFSLAPFSWLATLPVTGYVVGSAVSSIPAARMHRLYGRRFSFLLGIGFAVLSALLCLYAAITRNFVLLVAGTFIAGFYQANAQLYRFAAAEIASSEYREKAVSWVLAGGLIGAVLGPNLVVLSKDLFEVEFAGAYLVLSFVGILAAALMATIRFAPPVPKNALQDGPPARPLLQIIKQPVFLLAMLGASLGYGVMNLLMAATPLAMKTCGFPFKDAAWVLEWHVIGMFAPGFFTGALIKRYGAVQIIVVGVILNFVCIGVALSGVEFAQFFIALFLLGVGWNFMFTASTVMSLGAYHASERDKAQAAINFAVFFMMALSSFSSGALVTTSGWALLNYLSLIPMVLVSLALVWYVVSHSLGKMTICSTSK